MTKRIFTRDELMASDSCVSPRTRNRWPAVKAWQAALPDRGWPISPANKRAT